MSAALRKAADRISETAIDDEIVVMSLDSGDFFSLTGTAKAIWQLIDGIRDRATLIEALAAEFSVEPEIVGVDLDAFLAEMGKAGLIEAG
jgi:hypothetical protein